MKPEDSRTLEKDLIESARRVHAEIRAIVNRAFPRETMLRRDALYAVAIAAPYRERSYVTFQTARALGVPRRAVESLALGAELAMIAALTCDDTIDRTRMRCGKPSLGAKVGWERARLVSEILFGLAVQKGTELRGTVKTRNSDGAASHFLRAAMALYCGEYAATYGVNNPRVPLARIDGLADLKGGLLLEACTAGVARLSGRRELLNAAGRVGRWLGIALQHRNDLLDFIAQPTVVGKPVLEDIVNGQPNLVISCMFDGRARLSLTDVSLVQRAWNSGAHPNAARRDRPETRHDSRAIRALARRSGALLLALDHLRVCCRNVERAVGKLPRCGARARLQAFTTMVSDIAL